MCYKIAVPIQIKSAKELHMDEGSQEQNAGGVDEWDTTINRWQQILADKRQTTSRGILDDGNGSNDAKKRACHMLLQPGHVLTDRCKTAAFFAGDATFVIFTEPP